MKIDRTIAVAIIFFVILLLVFLLVVPAYKTYGRLQKELAEKRAQFNAEYDYYAAIAKTHSELQAHREDLEKINDALPSDPSLGKTTYFLQQLARENGMILKSFSVSKSASKSAQSGNQIVSDMVFSLDLLGDYVSLGRLLIALEKSSRIFEVTDISFGSASQRPVFGADQPQFQMQQTFSFKVQIKTHSY